jgi:DNA-binding beta-propeller fold protein YncE
MTNTRTALATLAIAVSLANPLLAQFAYVANNGSNDVSGYTINATTGVLTAIAGSPFPAGTVPFSVAVDPTGKFAYVANGNNVSGYTINATTGALTAIAGSSLSCRDSSGFRRPHRQVRLCGK